jgi:hypothetical protein
MEKAQAFQDHSEYIEATGGIEQDLMKPTKNESFVLLLDPLSVTIFHLAHQAISGARKCLVLPSIFSLALNSSTGRFLRLLHHIIHSFEIGAVRLHSFPGKWVLACLPFCIPCPN